MRRVLVVDDDPGVCGLIADMLAEVRLKAVCVTSDTEAYRIIPTLPTIKAMVIDINLGAGTTGFDVARFARRVIPKVPIIYISGEATPEMFAGAGVPDTDFLLKPFAADDLLRVVAGRIAKSRRPS
jgi:DNA-binding NtrC family response regulator